MTFPLVLPALAALSADPVLGSAVDTVRNGFSGLFGLLGLIFLIWGVVSIAKSSLGTGGKAIWIIVAIIFPFLGPLCWLIFGGRFRG